MHAAPETALKLLLEQSAELGEGLQWHAGSQLWWWTDIEGASLQAWSAEQGLQVVRLPERLGCFAHTRSGRILLGLAKRLAIAQPGKPLALQTLVAVEAGTARTRINDGRCDRRGHFVFGTLNEAPEREPLGSFYQYSKHYGLRRLALPAVAIANSVCFSLDGRTMYFCDSLQGLIQQCAYDAASAEVADIRPFVRVETGSPDGSVIDAEGCLWNAQWGAARIARYDPKGRLIQYYPVPVPNPSCPALGGPAGNELAVTTARQDMNPAELLAQPLAGSLFGLHLPAPLAVPEVLFDDAD